MEDLNGQVALVTGAAGGIGRAIAAALAHLGATVCLVGRDRDALARVAAEIAGRAVAFACDVTEDAQVAALPQRVASDAGPIDILIHSAAAYFQEPLETAPVE